MFQTPLPKEYAGLTPDQAAARIRRAKKALGDRLIILGHHYQRDEIIEHADYRGDSFKLAKMAAQHPEAEFIVFCGVHFMAESADILTPDHMKVILPNLAAGCSMADMANLFQVRSAWKQLEQVLSFQSEITPARTREPVLAAVAGRQSSVVSRHSSVVSRQSSVAGRRPLLPITYINSAANLKAFVGERGGAVCTSTTAPNAVEWALQRAERVLFFPDQHLGRNTGVKLGYDKDRDMCVWDPHKPMGGNTEEKIRQSKFILWQGYCSVHTRFTVEQIEDAKAKYPDVNILVHPECPYEIVQMAGFTGSTEFICKTVRDAEPGTAWAIGTEINLVNRLAKEHPDKTIFCLDSMICPCSTMYRIHPSFLCWTLENLVNGTPVNVVEVPEKTKRSAKLALDRMLSIT